MSFTQSEVLEKALKIIDLWPPEGYACPHSEDVLRQELVNAAHSLNGERLLAAYWVAVLLLTLQHR